MTNYRETCCRTRRVESTVDGSRATVCTGAEEEFPVGFRAEGNPSFCAIIHLGNMFVRYRNILKNQIREGVKKTVFLGLCPKLWVGGGPKSQTL